MACLALANGAAFGEMRQLAASLGYGNGRPDIHLRYQAPPIDPMAYLMPQMPQQQQQFNGLGMNPASGFEFLQQLAQGQNKNKYGGKFGGMGNGGSSFGGMMGGMGSISGFGGAGMGGGMMGMMG